jgi:hypothetical protein
MVPVIRWNQGPARDQQLFFVLIFGFHLPICFFLLSLYFAFAQIVTDARSNKHAHVTMGYSEFLRLFEVEVLCVDCLGNVF